MTIDEAKQNINRFNENNVTTEDDEFLFLESLNFLIDELHDPHYMMELGGYYYEQKKFDLALKYYEMAATFDYDPAYECLGYIWYYGRTGERDYKKAFDYFSKLKDKGDFVATYKVADMYKNGYYVEKSQEKYEEIIEDLYPKVKNLRNVFDPVPEVFTRLARIKSARGEKEEAINLYLFAKDFLAQRISYNAFFGNLNIMKWLIDDLYTLLDFDKDYFDFYDLYYLLKSPNKIMFMYKSELMEAESVMEGDECEVCFNGKWFHDRDDFFKNASVDGKRLVAVYRDLHGFEVIE